MKYHQTSFFILSLLAIVLTACTEEIKNELGLGHEIAFKIMSSQPAATRSAAEDKVPEPQPFVCQGDTFYLQTEITPMDSTMGRQATTRGAEKNASNLQADGFKVSAYNTSDGTTRGTSYFEYLTATYADSKFTPQDAGTAKYWPAGKLMFYAYYPAATASNGITQGANASTLTYIVPSTPANQPDLMTARATDQQYTSGDGTTALTFNHALCAIKFQTGKDIAGGTINSITFNNIYTSGTYNLDTQTWDFTGKSRGNVSFSGLNIATTEGTAGTAVLSGNNTLMMIPQTLISSSTITLNLTDKYGETYNLVYLLNATSWTKGTIVVYTITTKGVLLDYYRRNPLWYCSKYNVTGVNGNTFDTQENTDQGKAYNYYAAMDIFSGSRTSINNYSIQNKTMINPDSDAENGMTFRYHLPTAKEWCSIIPAYTEVGNDLGMIKMPYDYSSDTQYTDGKNHVITENECCWGYNSTTKVARAYNSYITPKIEDGEIVKWYAVRFLGTKYCSVWQYVNMDFGTTNARLEVKSEIIREINKVDISTLENIINSLKIGTYTWKSHAITRKLYACGYGSGDSAYGDYVNSKNVRLLYMSSTSRYEDITDPSYDDLYCGYLNWQRDGNYCAVLFHSYFHPLSVRPFRDN